MMQYYHGAGRKGPYFEGWYLKYQTKNGRAIAFIPAFHMDSAGQRAASLQVITDRGSWWLEYPERDFRASEKRLQISLGESVFREEGARLCVDRDGLAVHGTLRHGHFTPLKSDIMGPFRFLPGMECAHGVISMGHRLDGTLTLNGETMDFAGGLGYVESDRGRSFPSAYLWTQCTWQELHSGSVMLSIAAVPLGAGRFTGCICAVRYDGREYRLATYRGVRIMHWSDKGALIRQGKYRLAVDVLEEQGRPLRAPVEGAMGRIVHESLCARARYRFWVGQTLLFDRIDCCAGFEYAGESQTIDGQPRHH